MTELSANAIFGKQLGRFVLLEKLGEGGMAVVYNAYDSRMERNVAIKVILPSRQSSRLFLDRFMVEARSLAQLSHTNIVKVLDYGEEDGAPYLVMDFIQGGTLKEVMSQAIPWDQAAAILAPIARALDYVHKQQIVHRDVKPSNILIDENDQPMLSDFGVVKMVQENEADLVATGVGVGTPDYMSPEQGLGKEVGFSADIYALGVVFYEMVTGQKPYTAETPMAVVIKHVTGSFPRPRAADKSLPQIVEDVILKAVAKEPNKRYVSMGDFADALELLARGGKVDEKRVRKALQRKRAKKITPRKGSRALRMVLLTVLFLLLAAGGAAGWLYGDQMFSTPIGQEVARVISTRAPVLVATFTSEPSATVTPTESPTPTSTATLAPSATTKPSPTTPPTPKPTPTRAPVAYTGPSLIGSPLPFTPVEFSPGKLEKIALLGIGGINAVSWSPDGARVALASTDGIFVYNYTPDQIKLAFYIPTNEWVETVLMSEDGRIFAGLRDGRVAAWEVSTRAKALELTYVRPDDVAGREHLTETSSPAKVVALSKSARYLAVGYENGGISAWNISKQPLRLFSRDQGQTVTGIVFSQDERSIYVADTRAAITSWQIDTRSKQQLAARVGQSRLLAGSPDGKFLLTASGGQVSLIDTAADRTLTSFQAGDTVMALAFNNDSSLLAMGLKSGKILIFAMPPLDQIMNFQLPLFELPGAHPDAITALAFAPDGRTLASSSWKDGLKTWDASTGAALQTLSASMTKINRMAFSPDRKWLAVSYADEVVRIWKVDNGTLFQTYPGHLPAGIPFSSDGRYLVIAETALETWREGKLQIVDYPSGDIAHTLTGYRPGWQVAFNSGAELLVAGSPSQGHIWDTSTWEKLEINGGPNNHCWQMTTPENEVLALVWERGVILRYTTQMQKLCENWPNFADPAYLLNNNSRAVFQNKNGKLWLWDFNPDRIVEFNPHGIQESNQVFVAASHDDSIVVFNSENKFIALSTFGGVGVNQPVAMFPRQDDYQYTAAVSRDNKILALGSQFGTVSLWASR